MIWRVLEGEIGPFSTIFTEKLTNDFAATLADASGDGYRLLGRHEKLPAYLAIGSKDYMVLSGRDPGNGPEATGIAVEDPEAVIELGYGDDRFEVFSSGAVGPLGLHLPGLRFKPDGRFVYLVAKGGEGHFFAVDFKPVKEL